MLPGLVEHLRRAVDIIEINNDFELNEAIPDDPSERRKMMCKLFKKFTRKRAKTGKNETMATNLDNNNPNTVMSLFLLIQYLQVTSSSI